MRIEHREQIEVYDYPSFRMEVTRQQGKKDKLVGWLKSRVTGLPGDQILFKDEEGLAELLDDLSEAQEALEVIAEEGKNEG